MKAISCRFKSCYPHQAKIIRTFSQLEMGSDLSFSTLIRISTVRLTDIRSNVLRQRVHIKLEWDDYYNWLDKVQHAKKQSDFRFVVTEVLSEKLLLIVSRRLYTFLVKDTGYGGKAIALKIHIKYSSDDLCVFFNHDHLIGFFIFEIAERRYHHKAFRLNHPSTLSMSNFFKSPYFDMTSQKSFRKGL